MIMPTIGRIVLVHRPGASPQPEPALITFIHSPELINVGGFDSNGNPFSCTSLPLEGGDETKRDQSLAYAFWMPYQKQAASRSY